MKNNEFLKDLFFRYGVYNDIRYRKNEKHRFIATIKKEAFHMGYNNEQILLQEHKNFKNIMIGNFNKNDTILITNYDTPLNFLFGSKLINIFDWKKNKKNRVSNIFISTILFFVVMLSMFVILNKYNFFSSDKKYYFFIFVFIFFMGLTYFSLGIPKRHNIVYNTSALISTLYIAKHLKNNNENISIILTDFGCINNIGDYYASKFLESKKIQKNNIYYICPFNNKNSILIKQVNTDKKYIDLFNIYDNINVVYNSEIINLKKDKDLDINNFVDLNNKIIKLISNI